MTPEEQAARAGLSYGAILSLTAGHGTSALYERIVQAIEQAVKENDKIHEEAAVQLVRLRVEQARREEREACADWFRETFCPRSGVNGDEKHARGDCDYCNMARALRARDQEQP